jgi:LacI family transcriptional regulator
MTRTEPAHGGRPVTLTDVARLAGVSIGTASKALNGRDQVAPATRQRVIDAADRLAFSPNPLARGLLAGRTGTVGLITSDLDGRFVIPILMGAEDAFGAGQVNVSSATPAATPSASSTTCAPCSAAGSTG